MSNGRNKLLEKIKDPKFGLFGKDKLISKFPKSQRKQVRKILNTSQTFQVHKEPKRNLNKFQTIRSPAPYNQIQGDLADFQNLARSNRGVKYLFVLIDVYSRYLWIIPLKNKESTTINKKFREWLKKQPKISNYIIFCENKHRYILCYLDHII